MTAPEQLGFEQMPRRLFRATPTRLLGWLDCPRRYRFTYLDRPPPQKGPPWAHNSLGAAVHTALASWWRLPLEHRTTDAAGELVERGWLEDGFRDEAQSYRWRQHARRLVEGYVKDLDPTDEPKGVERTVALTTSTLALSGRVDRIDERLIPADDPDTDGPVREVSAVELVIVDYKTGRHVLDTDDARTSLALAVYAAAAARTLRRRCRRVELHHLPTGTVAAWEHSPESITRHLLRAESIGEEAYAAEQAFHAGLDDAAKDRVFPPIVGSMCQWCDFSNHCPEGRRAYASRRPWDGLDPEV